MDVCTASTAVPADSVTVPSKTRRPAFGPLDGTSKKDTVPVELAGPTVAVRLSELPIVVVDADAASVTVPTIFVVMLVEQVMVSPPTLPVPLHWFTVIGMAALTWAFVLTLQTAVPPPPFAEPLHWVTSAFVAAAGYGSQFTVPVAAVPTH